MGPLSVTVRMLSPRELADALGVSESSLKRWVDAGKIVAAKTEGGHRKIPLSEAVRFIRETNAPLARPELLDMPEIALAPHAGPALFEQALARGDALAARGYLLQRYLAGTSLAELADGPIREAMHHLGELWKHDPDGVFVEHRATDCCLQALAHVREMLAPAPDAPVAVGCTPGGDPYLIASFLAAIVCASVGMRAVNLGPDTPMAALGKAIAAHRPALVWISASAPMPPAEVKAVERFVHAHAAETQIVVGGRASDALARYRHVVRVETMTELATIAQHCVARARQGAAR